MLHLLAAVYLGTGFNHPLQLMRFGHLIWCSTSKSPWGIDGGSPINILHRYKKKVSCASLSHLNSLCHDSGRGRSERGVRLPAEILQSAQRSYSGLCASSAVLALLFFPAPPACKKAPGACRLFPSTLQQQRSKFRRRVGQQ